MNIIRVLCILCALLLCSFNVEGHKILAIFPMPFPSHYFLASSILKKLAGKGHEVTVLSPYPQKVPLKNYKDVSLESLADILSERKKGLFNLEAMTVLEHCQFLTTMGLTLSEATLSHENVQKLLHSNEKFDLVIVPQYINEALVAVAGRYKAPVILLATMPLMSWASFELALPWAPAHIPHLLSTFTGRMNFWERLMNTYYGISTIIYHQMVILPQQREIAKKYIPGEPDLYDILPNVSLTLINSHISIYDATPTVPHGIEIGGFHLHPPKALPEDLQKFIGECQDGLILFSMGSNLKSSDLPLDKRASILKAFSKLKQKILWKFETDDIPNLPKNVFVMKWIPQQDVLEHTAKYIEFVRTICLRPLNFVLSGTAHPNVRAFITHGGLLSTTESIYHGVPLVGIPIFADQKMNMATAASYGYAVIVPFQELTEEKLSVALDEVLNNQKYKANVQRRSEIMRDRPMEPLDSAVYWTEYVIRHKGAPHLKHAGTDLYWFQRTLVDVFVFSVAVILLLFYVLRIALRKIRKMCSTKATTTRDKRKKIK